MNNGNLHIKNKNKCKQELASIWMNPPNIPTTNPTNLNLQLPFQRENKRKWEKSRIGWKKKKNENGREEEEISKF